MLVSWAARKNRDRGVAKMRVGPVDSFITVNAVQPRQWICSPVQADVTEEVADRER